MNLEAVIRAVQNTLGVTEDGFAGPETWGAIYNALTGKNVPEEHVFTERVDERSESVIAKLQPEIWTYARALVKRAAQVNIDIKIISGFRSFAQQDALFAQGRTVPGSKVTNAKGGESNHNFGIAFDVGVFDGNDYLGSSPAYDIVGALGVEIGLDWGGYWANFVDKPHFQLRPGWAANLSEREMLAELRARSESGTPLYA